MIWQLNWLAQDMNLSAPPYRAFGGTLALGLRYGENPHQSAAFSPLGGSSPWRCNGETSAR